MGCPPNDELDLGVFQLAGAERLLEPPVHVLDQAQADLGPCRRAGTADALP